MKTILPYIKKTFVQSCICFTLLTLFLFLIGSSIPAFGNAIDVSNILTLYLFALLLALANLLLLLPKIEIAWRVLIHYLASLAAFYVAFILIAMKLTAARSILSGILVFTIFYVIFIGIYLCFYLSLTNEKGEKKKKSTYKSIYK